MVVSIQVDLGDGAEGGGEPEREQEAEVFVHDEGYRGVDREEREYGECGYQAEAVSYEGYDVGDQVFTETRGRVPDMRETCGERGGGRGEMQNEEVTCPFCGEQDFDKIGLKDHLTFDCKAYRETDLPKRMFRNVGNRHLLDRIWGKGKGRRK